MDARAFSEYLKKVFQENIDTVRNNLESGAYPSQTNEAIKAAGQLAVLKGINDRMEDLLAGFYKVPDASSTTDSMNG